MKRRKSVKKKIEEERDFIYYETLNNSLTKLVEMYPNGIDDEKIARVLQMTVEELDVMYQNILKKLRDKLNIDPDDLD